MTVCLPAWLRGYAQLFFQGRESATDGASELLSSMFAFSPRERSEASEALAHRYFAEENPRPLSATSLAVALEPLLRSGGSESSASSDDESGSGGRGAGGGGSDDGPGGFGGAFRRGPLFGFGSGGSSDGGGGGGGADSGGSTGSSLSFGGAVRQPMFGSGDSAGGGGFGSSGSSAGMGSTAASGGGRMGGLIASGATRSLFDSDDDDPDL